MAPPIMVTMKQTEPVTVAFVSMKGPYSQISEAFGKLYGWIGRKDFVPSGPPLGIYHDSPGQVAEDQLTWELCSPISGDVPPSTPGADALGVKRLEPVQVAATTHRGPFSAVGGTYEALAAWVAENGYQVNGPAQEVYLSNPGDTPPKELVTEVRFPVTKA